MRNKFLDDTMKYIKAQQEAEKAGEHEFTCPVCGGKARWARVASNNHLRSVCSGCGIALME